MPKSLRTNLELAVQIVIAIAVVIVAGVVVKRSLFPLPTKQGGWQEQSPIKIGAQINIPNIVWEQNEKTLVFFLKNDCRYCKSAAPFYRELIETASKRNVKSLAILPDPIEEARQYVRSLQLPIENVQTGSLASFQIPGAPSVLFVDNKGTVRSVWIGADPARENEMRDQLTVLFEAGNSNQAAAK